MTNRENVRARVLYQLSAAAGAFSYIDRGYIHGYAAAGADVVSWNGKTNEPDIVSIISEFKPNHFVAFMQQAGNYPASWAQGEILDILLRHKQRNGLFVSARVLPRNLRDLFSPEQLDFADFPEGTVPQFYLQKDRPIEAEMSLLKSGFVDLIRSPICHRVYEVCFRDILNMGLRILEEPHAADLTTYQKESGGCETHVLYVGGCWHFKWFNMRPYVTAMKSAFGKDFRIFGSDWPPGFSEGRLDDADYSRTCCAASINLAFHEPSQVLDFPFAGNERIFKLLAMECFVISDSNPLLSYHFDVGRDLVRAEGPESMVELTHYYLAHPREADQIRLSGRRRVIAEHTYEYRAQRLLSVAAGKAGTEQILRYRA